MPSKNKPKKLRLLANDTTDAFQDIVEGDGSEYEWGMIDQMQLWRHDALCTIHMRLLHFGETKSFIHIAKAKCIIYLRDHGVMFTKIPNVTPSVYQCWATSILYIRVIIRENRSILIWAPSTFVAEVAGSGVKYSSSKLSTCIASWLYLTLSGPHFKSQQFPRVPILVRSRTSCVMLAIDLDVVVYWHVDHIWNEIY